MAVTHYGVNANEAVKLWSRKILREALKQTWVFSFVGRDSSSLCQIKEELNKSEGDRVRMTLRMQLSGAGRKGDDTLEGYEESLVTRTDDMLIDQLRHAVRSGGKMSEQRVPFSVREENRMALQDWWSDRIDQTFFNQLAGANVTDVRYTGMNATLTADSSHIIYAGVATADTGLSSNSSQIFTLEIVDKCVLKARTISPVIRPVKTGYPKANFVMFITPEMHYDLRRNTSTMEWADIQKAALQGGKLSDNPIFTGAIGLYNGVILHEAYRLPLITTSDGANKGGAAVFAGAQAMCLAVGGGYGLKRMSYREELFDYGNQLGTAAGLIWGMKKSRYNSKDFATITVHTAHSTAAIAASGR